MEEQEKYGVVPDFKNSLEHYLKSGGVSCLFCGSGEIEGGFITIEQGSATQSIICLDCEAEWDDRYKLTDVVLTMSV